MVLLTRVASSVLVRLMSQTRETAVHFVQVSPLRTALKPLRKGGGDLDGLLSSVVRPSP